MKCVNSALNSDLNSATDLKPQYKTVCFPSSNLFFNLLVPACQQKGQTYLNKIYTFKTHTKKTTKQVSVRDNRRVLM